MSAQSDELLQTGQLLDSIENHPSLRLESQRKLLRIILLVSDGLMLVLAFTLAYWLRFHINLTLAPEIIPSLQFYAQVVAVLLPLWLGLFALFRLYDFQYLLGGTAEYSRAFNACTSGMMLVIVVTFIDPTFIVARGWLLSAWLFSILLVCSARFTIRRIAYMLRQQGYFVAPALIVGNNEEALALAEQLSDWRRSGLRVLGLVGTNGGSHTPSPDPLVGTVQEIEPLIDRGSVEEVIVATTALDREELLLLFERVSALPRVEMRLSSGLFEVMAAGLTVRRIGYVPLASISRLRLDPTEIAMKAVLDYSLTLLGLLLLLPFLTVIAILIKADSPGPVLYRRRVLGVGGKTFDALKFRTMHPDSAEILAAEPALLAELQTNGKLKDDPRITRCGRWLRRYSLDELPQLFNVLLGQMSLVGPRMISPEEGEKYGPMLPNLLTVKPGITGLWQVSGRSDLTYEERVRLDMHYIRTYTIWQDLQLLFIQTLPAVLKARGAY